MTTPFTDGQTKDEQEALLGEMSMAELSELHANVVLLGGRLPGRTVGETRWMVSSALAATEGVDD